MTSLPVLYSAKLPDSSVMYKRLKALGAPFFEARIYTMLFPQILEKAGRTLTGPGVAMAAAMSVSDYCSGMPDIVHTVMYAHMGELITAMVDDERLQKEALEFWNETITEFKGLYDRVLADGMGPAYY